MLHRVIFFIIVARACLGICLAQKKASQPNILYIMSDDHTSQAVGAYGGRLAPLNPTPNIDALASEGVVFDNTFCTNSICCPSRATIITGQYSQTNGVIDLDQGLSVEKQYLPMEMKKLGYSTAIIGKWHLHNEPVNFDYYKVLPGQGKYHDPVFREKGKGQWPNNTVNTSGHSSDVITDISIDYLEHRDKTKPFFLMHHFKAPHDFFEYADRYENYLSDVIIPEPASLYEQGEFGGKTLHGDQGSLNSVVGTSVSARHHGRNYIKTFGYEDADLSFDEKTHLAYQHYLKAYLRCVKGVDDNLGRLFGYLKKEGLWENTIIIYTADQGMMLGEHDLQDKRWMYEESLRMPFIVRDPSSKINGTHNDLLINNTDFAPTMISLAGGKVPAKMQGRSFQRTLRGKTEKDWRTATYYRYWMHMIHHWVPAHFGVRTQRYKLIFYYSEHYLDDQAQKPFYWKMQYDSVTEEIPVSWEFYDLEKDPKEMNNRYDDPAYQEIISKLKEEILAQRAKYNETDEHYPEIQKVIDEHWDDQKAVN
ncbi:sulfatase [Persicobacter psychrovividus]|uniref:Acetylglucosamine-6-sulfatase n=1 Tax=Persicobacter psychrovividus TaxID=387638 RepID=A0ABM7VMM8_9BACT|nr:acetylglucosamine-6-sulfatase [Persicobacter psychrovividus]